MNALNIYQINLFQFLKFMYKVCRIKNQKYLTIPSQKFITDTQQGFPKVILNTQKYLTKPLFLSILLVGQ